MSPLLLSPLALAEDVEHGGGGAHGTEASTEAHGGGAEGEHHGVPWDVVAFQAMNVALFLGILVWAARRPIGDWVRNRSFAVSHHIDEAARVKDEAAARFSDIEAKLVSLDRRIDEMKAEADVEAKKEAAAIAERAVADAARIRETAERTIREESLRARNDLRTEAAALAVQLARETIKRNLSAEDEARLAREFLGAVERDRSRNGEA